METISTSSETRVQSLSVGPSATILDTLKTIDRAADSGAPIGIAVVVGSDGKLVGVVTDGDVRQAILEGIALETPVSEIMSRSPITVPAGSSPTEMIKLMKEQVRRSAHIRDSKVEYLVVTDAENNVVDVVDTYGLFLRGDITNWNVAVVGLGFVGLTLAVTLSDVGFHVHGVDTNDGRARQVADGEPHFYELGLEPLLKHQLSTDKFRVDTELPAGIDIYIVAVGTPLDHENKPTLGSIRAAAAAIARQLKSGDLVLLRSTVPVGTTRNVVIPILEEGSGLKCGPDFHVGFTPERTVEGRALNELRTLPQVVGGYDRRSSELAGQVFSKLSPSIVRVDSLEAAEMVKLINNSFRDVSFAFANELAIICDHWDLDAVKIITAANSGYPRNPIPVPSPGVGGFCLTKDPVIFAWSGRDKGYEPLLAVGGRQVNELMVGHVVKKIRSFFGENRLEKKGSKLFVMGFAFKGYPETSDIRHSTTVDVTRLLEQDGFDIVGYDHVVDPADIENLGYRFEDVEEGFQDASAVLIMNNHQSFAELDLYSLIARMRKPGLFFDGWHIFQRSEIEQFKGMVYAGLSGSS